MKQWWIYLLAGLFLFTGIPVGAATNQPVVTLSVADTEVPLGENVVEVTVTYDTTECLLDGGFIITFPADKLELVVGEKDLPFSDPANDFTPLPNGIVNAQNKENGWIRVSFMKISGIHGQGVIAKLPFRILDPSVEAEYEISVRAERLVKWVVTNTQGENLVSDETPIEDIGYITVGVDSQSTTSAPTTITTTTQTTTLAPTTRETTTTTSAVTTTTEPTTVSETTTTSQLPTSRQPEEEANTVPEPTERDAFPRWILFVVAAVTILAVLIPLAIKLRKT